MNHTKYQPFPVFKFSERTWPERRITKAPVWCSVDLRDGNQALEIPMSLEQKIDFFKFLVRIGFKEIEVGFPAASDTEFAFTRALIEGGLIPDDVTIQVLTQAREHIIRRTFESLEGVRKAVVHVYNSTSTLQRDVVFGMDQADVKNIAVEGARLVLSLAEEYGRNRFMFEYSPESFTGTEMDYAVDVCNAVIGVWNPTPENKVIINLPSTVELITPNVYADQIEYVCKHLNNRENVVVSLHTHNDRGTGVAASELGVLAGADRVEGTLFGNGERTGNADILNIAMNLYTQGIDPELNFSKIDEAVNIYERSTRMGIHPRHPYAGSLVYTAFSGSHQDAINKGMARMRQNPSAWAVPYLTIDPVDVGRTYDPIIRINSQSGKGGVAFVLEKGFGLIIPKPMQQDFSLVVTKASDAGQKEMSPQEIFDLFTATYINIVEPIKLVSFKETANGDISVVADVVIDKNEMQVSGSGNGLISAFSDAIAQKLGKRFDIVNYSEHSMEVGTRSRAITYIHIADEAGKQFFGAGVSSSISKSSLRAFVSAINKALA